MPYGEDGMDLAWEMRGTRNKENKAGLSRTQQPPEGQNGRRSALEPVPPGQRKRGCS